MTHKSKVRSISMEELKIKDTVYFYWEEETELRATEITETLKHWDKQALAFGALVDGLFVLIKRYNRTRWDRMGRFNI